MIENKLPQSLTAVPQEFETIYDISLVIPTRNEAGNIEPLLMRIHQAVKRSPQVPPQTFRGAQAGAVTDTTGKIEEETHDSPATASSNAT